MVAKGTYSELIEKPDLSELLSSLQQVNETTEQPVDTQNVEKREHLARQLSKLSNSHEMYDSILSLAQSQTILQVQSFIYTWLGSIL
jgi:hypothetical protein